MIGFPTRSKFYHDHILSLGRESLPLLEITEHRSLSHESLSLLNINEYRFDSDFKASRSSSSDLRIAINPVKLESVYMHISAMSVAVEVVLVISSSMPR